MRQFINIIINQFGKSAQNSIPLGRWNIDYCLKKTATKIDLANEDHCGPCGQYNIHNDKQSIHHKPSNSLGDSSI